MDVVAVVIIGVLAAAWTWSQCLNYIDYRIRRRRIWRNIEQRIREDR